MTLTAEQSSNKAWYEAATTAEIIDIIRTAMGEGCIRPCHVYDAVDELICRIQDLENRQKRNCDVGTPIEQAERFNNQCFRHHTGRCSPHCSTIPAKTKVECALKWAQAPYAAEEGSGK